MTAELILVVDDHREIRESVASILKFNGFDVKTAPEAEEALRILEEAERPPDVIVSDIRMPGMDGYEFLEAVRNQDRLQNVPFIFLTALGEDQNVTYGYERGIDGYIVKPFQPDRLVAAVRNRIQRTRQIQTFAEKQLDRTRYTLLQVLSHELRTPLTYVMGGMSLLDEALAALNNGSDYGHVVKVINSGTQRLYRLTEQTSILGELVSGYAAMHWEQLSQPTTLNNVVKEALTTIESHAAEKRVELEIQLGPELAIFGINTMLVKGIYEILHNGVQYSEPGQIVTVQTYATDDDRAVIQVDDHGRGILAEDVERVWDLMVQSERGKYEHQGLGLGLTLTRGIFEVHKGDAQLESVHGEGTTVWLSLPIYQE